MRTTTADKVIKARASSRNTEGQMVGDCELRSLHGVIASSFRALHNECVAEYSVNLVELLEDRSQSGAVRFEADRKEPPQQLPSMGNEEAA